MLLPPAFAAVTRALQQLVKSAVPTSTEVTALGLAEAAGSSHASRVNLFLYRITPDAALRNQRAARVEKTVTPALELRYLLTAYENPARAIGQTEADLLWTTLNVMHATPHVAVPALGRDVSVRIETEILTLQDIAVLWQSARTEIRATLAYVIHLPPLLPLEIPASATLEDIRNLRLDRLGGTA